MRRVLGLVVLLAFVVLQNPGIARAGVLSKLFSEWFSTSASRTASEAGQAAARNVDEAVPVPRARDEDRAVEAGKFIVEESAGDALKDGLDRKSDNDRYRRKAY